MAGMPTFTLTAEGFDYPQGVFCVFHLSLMLVRDMSAPGSTYSWIVRATNVDCELCE